MGDEMNTKTRFENEDEALAVFDQPEHPEWDAAYQFLLEHGSEETKTMLREAGRAALRSVFGVEFSRQHVDRDGNPVMTAQAICDALGMPVEDLLEYMRREGIEGIPADEIQMVN